MKRAVTIRAVARPPNDGPCEIRILQYTFIVFLVQQDLLYSRLYSTTSATKNEAHTPYHTTSPTDFHAVISELPSSHKSSIQGSSAKARTKFGMKTKA